MTDTILIVDDDIDMRLALRRVLKHAGYATFVASQAQEALDILAETPEVTLVVSDLCMPGMDGLELLAALQERSTPAVPMVLITAHGTVQNAVRALKAGASDYLLKPFSHEQFLKTVEEAIRQYRGIWNHVAGKGMKKGATPLVTQSPQMRELYQTVERLAQSSATILIQGESGVGKEVISRRIHLLSPRRDEPFVAINCAAIPENLLESELFGFVKGSFTGAIQDKAGKFAIAEQGTLLLDEISEMPLALQSKLLRVLQEKEFFPIGSRTPIPMQARLIATTNRHLEDWVAKGHFREDLYYRLNVIPLFVPPLRERREDIEALALYFIEEFNIKNPKYKAELSQEALAYLGTLPWPGNIRELENSITRIALLSGHPRLSKEDCVKYVEPTKTPAAHADSDHPKTLDEVELDIILKTLKKMNGNRTLTAEALGITTRTLRNKLGKLKPPNMTTN